MLSALFMGAALPLGAMTHFIVFTTLGNVVGGFFFVAVVKYGHASVVRPGLRDPMRWHDLDENGRSANERDER